MMPSRTCTWRVGAIALAFCLAGCSESSPLRFGSLRRSSDAEEGPPKAASALHIPNPPSTARPMPDENVQQATFVPERKVEANPPALENPLRALYSRAAQTHAQMDSYIFRLKRREAVNGKMQPEEIIRVQVRRDPYSVHLKWLNEKSKGREVIYVAGKYGNKMQILLAPNDAFAILGRRHSIAPDDPMVKSESRHPITETGFASVIEGYGRVIAGFEKGDPREGTVKYLGRVAREEFKEPVEAVYQAVPANSDPLLPKGGKRWWFFDTTNGLPVLCITHDPTGEVEYNCLDHIQAPAQLDDNDFNPDRVWRK
jgi:hypothetical protein